MVNEEAIIERMRAAVLRGDFAPRQRLIEADLCERFEASRFEVRAALQALESEGLVERQRNRGARIREISVAEAVEISQVRMVVEGLVAALAAERATPADVARLQDIGQRMRSAVNAGEQGLYSDLNAELHGAIRDAAGHAIASRIISQLRGQLVRHQFALSRVPGRTSVSIVQHEELIRTIAAGDPVAAETAMRSHIASVIEALRALG